jgi:hypothetical protein
MGVKGIALGAYALCLGGLFLFSESAVATGFGVGVSAVSALPFGESTSALPALEVFSMAAVSLAVLMRDATVPLCISLSGPTQRIGRVWIEAMGEAMHEYAVQWLDDHGGTLAT